ncbi:bifunctional (p)ppGpp synthetase/guanosine-3',5'-bis(diphosphate) 3'-pyrophosphohydrolase, partial [Candidatus Peribacteria bacterium]|nr:bifunctional (p)ppGpp synthetase/guanosine-3',5'-bis(diphosphate) 3'-pyrophosphohydrolase [Candidatus Peribacteria bacterium]
MADPSYSTRDDFAAGLERLLTAVEAYYPDFTMIDRDRLTRAYWFGYGAHKDQKRKSGEPYYMHPVEASMILLQIKPDLDTLIACLLHDVIEDTPTTADEIEREFGPGVRFI